MRAKGKTLLVFTGVLWCASALFGMRALMQYSSRPGKIGSVEKIWPVESALKQGDGMLTLIMAVHPRCPCTRASITELNSIMMAAKSKLKAYVLVTKPKGVEQGWETTDVSERARKIPGVSVTVDEEGIEAKKLGASVSGEALLYSAKGDLIFSGGITAFRGHEGESVGKSRILSLIATGNADANNSKVFGCSLEAKVCPMGNVLHKGEVHGQANSRI